MKKDVVLVKASESDWQKALDIEKQFKNRLFCVSFENEAEAKQTLKTDDIYFAKIGDTIVGVVGIREKEDSFYVSKLMVLKNYRGKGYSKQILNLILGKYSGKKYTLVVHPENSLAIVLYLKAGFKIVGWKDNEFGDGEPKLMMELLN